MTYYLDTTIQLSKLFAPVDLRHRIMAQINTYPCTVSRYVRMEYLRWLEPSIQLHQMLQREVKRNPTTALDEVQARILMTFGRNQTKMLAILTLLSRVYGREMPLFMLHLETLIDYEFENLFRKNVTELPDPIAFPLMDLHAIRQEASYHLEPSIPYRRGEMPCHIVEFLQNHRTELKELALALNKDYPKMADACQRVLANPDDAQGNLCKTLGDVIIALQTPAHAVLWTTDASFDLICPALGISHLRERLTDY